MMKAAALQGGDFAARRAVIKRSVWTELLL